MLELRGLGFPSRPGCKLVCGISATVVLLAALLAVPPRAGGQPGDASATVSLQRWVSVHEAGDVAALARFREQLLAATAPPPWLLTELADALSNDADEQAALALLEIVAERWPDPAIAIARTELADGSAATLRLVAGFLSSLDALGEDEIRQVARLTLSPEGALAFDALSVLSERFDPARDDPSAFLAALSHSDGQVRSLAADALSKHYYMATPRLSVLQLAAMLESMPLPTSQRGQSA